MQQVHWLKPWDSESEYLVWGLRCPAPDAVDEKGQELFIFTFPDS